MLDVIAGNSSSAVGNPVDSTENGGLGVVDSSSSIVSNPVDSTEDDTSYLYLLVPTIVSIVFMSCGLDGGIVVPRGCCGL
ncbi:MAG: hypothetical protein ABS808_03800 [Wolbachia endosymbiont of Polyergus mexicanus]|uniref:Uncharacterized protein n=1 Tax=Wolbachia endosymbiont of Polyergus mexicanus TaxID=3171167 RepID=A0AAU7YH44_9RICK